MNVLAKYTPVRSSGPKYLCKFDAGHLSVTPQRNSPLFDSNAADSDVTWQLFIFPGPHIFPVLFCILETHAAGFIAVVGANHAPCKSAVDGVGR